MGPAQATPSKSYRRHCALQNYQRALGFPEGRSLYDATRRGISRMKARMKRDICVLMCRISGILSGSASDSPHSMDFITCRDTLGMFEPGGGSMVVRCRTAISTGIIRKPAGVLRITCTAHFRSCTKWTIPRLYNISATQSPMENRRTRRIRLLSLIRNFVQ